MAIFATIKYKLEILRLKMGKYDITNDCKSNIFNKIDDYMSTDMAKQVLER